MPRADCGGGRARLICDVELDKSHVKFSVLVFLTITNLCKINKHCNHNNNSVIVILLFLLLVFVHDVVRSDSRLDGLNFLFVNW